MPEAGHTRVVQHRPLDNLRNLDVRLPLRVINLRPIVLDVAPPPNQPPRSLEPLASKPKVRDAQREEEPLAVRARRRVPEPRQREYVDERQRVERLVPEEPPEPALDDLVEDLVLLGDVGRVRFHGELELRRFVDGGLYG